jgi:hypothetical protein
MAFDSSSNKHISIAERLFYVLIYDLSYFAEINPIGTFVRLGSLRIFDFRIRNCSFDYFSYLKT